MVRRSVNSHELAVREHTFRVSLLDAEARPVRDALQEAAARLSDGQSMSWLPSRPYPQTVVYAFQSAEARDAFAAWITEHHPALAAAMTR